MYISNAIIRMHCIIAILDLDELLFGCYNQLRGLLVVCAMKNSAIRRSRQLKNPKNTLRTSLGNHLRDLPLRDKCSVTDCVTYLAWQMFHDIVSRQNIRKWTVTHWFVKSVTGHVTSIKIFYQNLISCRL